MVRHSRPTSELVAPSQPAVTQTNAPSDPRLPPDPLAPATIASVTGDNPARVAHLLATDAAATDLPRIDQPDAAARVSTSGLTETDAALLREQPTSAAAAETVSGEPRLIGSRGTGTPATYARAAVVARDPEDYPAGRSLRVRGPCLVVISRVAGFKRSGLAHPLRATYPLDHFTDQELRQLAAEPNLELIAIGGEPGDIED